MFKDDIYHDTPTKGDVEAVSFTLYQIDIYVFYLRYELSQTIGWPQSKPRAALCNTVVYTF